MKAKNYTTLLLFILLSNNIIAQVKEHEILTKDAQGQATFIKFKETEVSSDNSSIISFLKKQYKLDDNIELKIIKESVTLERNFKFQKFHPYYKGLKVEFQEIIVHSKNEKISSVNGRGLSIQNLDINPVLSENKALQKVLNTIGAKIYAWEDDSYENLLKKDSDNLNATYYPKGELVIIDKNLIDKTFEPVLVYKFNIYAIKPLSRSFYYVDASNGNIILEDAIIKHIKGTASTRYSGTRKIETQQSGNSYRLRDYSRGSGIETYNMNNRTNYSNVTDFTDNDNNWTASEYHNSNKDDAALDVHWGAQMTYDYFMQKHGRNSIDNNGYKLKNYVHARTNWDNAGWDGERFLYGDGGSKFDAVTSLDIVAHEIGHGLDHFTSNLLYQREYGAIDEGLSDIWGAMVEFYTDSSKQTYEIGEDIKLGGGSERSMSNPNLRGHPDTYGGTYWKDPNCGVPNGDANDNCGVHANSGVLNYWFYLLAEGGNGTNDIRNTFNVTGIGKDKASKIVYKAQTEYFRSTTTYILARQFTIEAAEKLYGTNSTEVVNVCKSWYAVGVGNDNCAKLTGNSTICNTPNYTYTLKNYSSPNSTSWSVSSNLQKVRSNNTSITIRAINSSVNDIATITATNTGGTITRKDIWIGKPKIEISLRPLINYVYIDLIGANNTDISKQGITTTTWERVSGGGGCYANLSSGLAQGNCLNWTVRAKITATNSCGSTILYRDITPPPPAPCDTLTFNGESFIILNPCDDSETSSSFTTNNNNNIKRVVIYDITGRVMREFLSENINISNLSSGIYIAKVELTSGKILTKKIIK